jgi:hypothetical protein
MKSRHIYALVRRQTGIERQIEDALKSPCPDTLLISRLEKIRLQCREQMKEAITRKRVPINGDHELPSPRRQPDWRRHFDPNRTGGA